MKKSSTLKNKMFDCEASIYNLVELCLGQDSPEIILDNLSLIISLLANCRTHLDFKINLSTNKLKHKNNLTGKEEKDIKDELSDSAVIINHDKYKREDIENNKELLEDSYVYEIKEDTQDNDDGCELFNESEEMETNSEDYCKSEIIQTKGSTCDEIDGNNTTNINDSMHKNILTDSGGYSCDICNRKWKSNKALIKHKRTFDHDALKCDICRRYFAYPKDLKRHMLSHNNEKLFCCDICGKTLRTKWNVQFHKERVHGNRSKDLPCNICGKSFTYDEYLKSHMKIAHATEKSWACEQCGMTFNMKQSLSRHMQTHTEERPFQCDICEKPFKSERDLGAHQRTHSIVKPYQCEQCDVSLTHQSSMVRHYRTVHKIVKTVKYKPPVLTADD